MGACLIVMAANAALAATLQTAIGETFATSLVLWAIPVVLLGGQVRPRVAGRIPGHALKEIFFFGLLLAGIHVMFDLSAGH